MTRRTGRLQEEKETSERGHTTMRLAAQRLASSSNSSS